MEPSDRFYVWCFESERDLEAFAGRFRAFLGSPAGRRYLAGSGRVEAWAHAEPVECEWCDCLYVSAAAAQAAAAAGLEEFNARALDAVSRHELPPVRLLLVAPAVGRDPPTPSEPPLESQ